MNSKGHYIESKENETKGYSVRNHSGDEKIRFIKDVISKEITFNKLYNKESIDTNLFNKCSRDFIEKEKGSFVYNVKSEVTSSEINHLKNQNILLKQLIAELSHENDMLKNEFYNKGNSKTANE
jgi:transposase-like protein